MKMRIRLIILILFISADSLYAENETPPNAAQLHAPCLKTAITDTRGIVIVAHGLNLKPSKMGEPSTDGTLVKLLLDSGYDVYRVTLKGHGESLEDMRSVTRSDWINDAYSQYCRAKIYAEEKRLPLYLLGFSLGALVFEVLMNEETVIPVQFEKVILFSPAIAIKPILKTVLWLRPFAGDRFIIRSASSAEYRAQTGVSIAAYKTIFDMEESLRACSFKNNNANTIIFIDKKDEMISVKLLRERINQYELTNWRIHEVTNAGAVIRPKYHHLLIDTNCVSALTWEYISGTIIGFLD